MGYANIHLLPQEEQDRILGNPPKEEIKEEIKTEEKHDGRGRPRKY